MDHLIQWWHGIFAQGGDWFRQVIWLLVAGTVVWGGWRFLLSHLIKMADKTKMQWDDTVVHAVRSPVSWLIWLWVLSQCAEILFNHFTTFNIPEFNEFRDLLIISMFIWIASGSLIRLSTRCCKTRNGMPPPSVLLPRLHAFSL